MSDYLDQRPPEISQYPLGPLTCDQLEQWLKEEDPSRLCLLWKAADEMRRSVVGDEVHLRGLLEISNYCMRSCHYCGLNCSNQTLLRYRMTAEEIMASARLAVLFGYGTIVMQAGEDSGISKDWISDIIKRLKDKYELAITLSLGERSIEELQAWRDAGADRYLLKFETSDRKLFQKIHPAGVSSQLSRIELLREMKQMGYETGSGVMVGIPGQTWRILANDICLFRELDCDMIGCGPYIVHPQTELGREAARPPNSEQVPYEQREEVTYKVVALSRLVCPEANIPSTTALAITNKISGRSSGLQRGANVVMPNITPPHYRRFYEIYPDKASNVEAVEVSHQSIKQGIELLGRTVGRGPGGRRAAASNTQTGS